MDGVAVYLNLKKQKSPPGNLPEGCVSVTGGIRTPDRSLRRRMLYPAELL